MKRLFPAIALVSFFFALVLLLTSQVSAQSGGDSFGHPVIGREVAIPVHLRDGQEYELSIAQLIAFGEKLFTARWTSQEGAGRPLTKGTGAPLSDPSDPLVFPRNTNRLSGPDANACSGCHNLPYVGGGGDIVTKVFVEGNRFDFLTFDHDDVVPTRGAADERGEFVTQQSAAHQRRTIGMNGSGFIEMLARQMTADLQRIRDTTPIGGTRLLDTKGVSFGVIARRADGSWDTSHVVGLPPQSLRSSGPGDLPSLLILPFTQSGNAVSLRVFTNNAFFAGNQYIITRKLWGLYNSGPFMHHGQFTTMRDAILAHHGEAEASGVGFRAISKYDRDSIIEFLKSLQVLPLGTRSLCVDQNGSDIECSPDIRP